MVISISTPNQREQEQQHCYRFQSGQTVTEMSYDRYGPTRPSTSNPYGQSAAAQPSQRSTILNFDQDDDEQDGHMNSGVKDALLRECGHLTRSEQLLDEQFDIALKARENLIHQRSAINSIRDGFNNITGRFTSVNDLIKKIRIRRRRDTIIVAIVFSLCLGFLLYHMFL